MEGAPGAASSAAFDEAAGEPGLPARRMRSSVPSHEGPVAAPAGRTGGVRGHVTSPVRGRKSRDREARPGGAVDRSPARTAWCPLRRARSGSRLRTHAGNGSWAMAEAGGSPSSDALPVDLPEVQRPKAGRCRGPRGHPARGSSREAARSGIGWSVLGARGRKSVAEVGERHLSPSTLGASRRAGQRGDSLKRPARPLTRPAPDRGRRQGAGRAANVNNERDSPTRAARFGSIRWKASWFVRSPSS